MCSMIWAKVLWCRSLSILHTDSISYHENMRSYRAGLCLSSPIKGKLVNRAYCGALQHVTPTDCCQFCFSGQSVEEVKSKQVSSD